MLRWLRPTFSRPLDGDEGFAHKRYYRWWSVRRGLGVVKLGPIAISWSSYDPFRDRRFERVHVDLCVMGRWGWSLWPIRGNEWRSRSL